MRRFATCSTLAAAAAFIVSMLIAGRAGCAGFSAAQLKALDEASTVYVSTVRKDGNQSKSAPVWFTMNADRSELLIQTRKGSWKDRRIRRGSPVIVWIGGLNGPAFMGKAAITTETAVFDKILADFHKRYTMSALVGPSRATFESGERVAIRITPVRDLPAGFAPAPGTPAPALEASK
ncbi:MAG TPA: hypothetical protein VEC38_10125 [Candidatus Binataceae bacterium]|nr:hypothetical protein [Candidatus Binataceae bacterium]